MRKTVFVGCIAVLAGVVIVSVACSNENNAEEDAMGTRVELPEPKTDGEVPLERTIAERRSRRSFSDRGISLEDAGQILWSAQGLTEGHYRAAPSAGATYPLEMFVAVGEGTVGDLAAGVYRYHPGDHALSQGVVGDVRGRLAGAALRQGFVADGAMVVVIAADYGRTTGRYGERGIRYVHMEVGHVGGNIYLQCEALNLGTVAVGAFDDEEVEDVVGISGELDALYIMPVGHPR